MFHFVHWFRNSFCFCSRVIFSLFVFFTINSVNLKEEDLKWLKNYFWESKRSFWGVEYKFGGTLLFSVFPWSAIFRMQKSCMKKCIKNAPKNVTWGAWTEKPKIDMFPQDLHSSPQNQCLATRKWYFGHFDVKNNPRAKTKTALKSVNKMEQLWVGITLVWYGETELW